MVPRTCSRHPRRVHPLQQAAGACVRTRGGGKNERASASVQYIPKKQMSRHHFFHAHTHTQRERERGREREREMQMVFFHTSTDLAGLGGTGPAPAPIHRACICVVCVAAAPLTAGPLYAFPYADTALDTARLNIPLYLFYFSQHTASHTKCTSRVYSLHTAAAAVRALSQSSSFSPLFLKIQQERERESELFKIQQHRRRRRRRGHRG